MLTVAGECFTVANSVKQDHMSKRKERLEYVGARLPKSEVRRINALAKKLARPGEAPNFSLALRTVIAERTAKDAS